MIEIGKDSSGIENNQGKTKSTPVAVILYINNLHNPKSGGEGQGISVILHAIGNES